MITGWVLGAFMHGKIRSFDVKDIYVYFSNLQYVDIFKDLEQFRHIFDYPKLEIEKCTREEWGLLTINNDLRMHLLIDSGRNTACPWCGCEEIKINQSDPPPTMPCIPVVMYAECSNCRARGPAMLLPSETLIKQESIDRIKEEVFAWWSVRKHKRFAHENK